MKKKYSVPGFGAPQATHLSSSTAFCSKQTSHSHFLPDLALLMFTKCIISRVQNKLYGLKNYKNHKLS